MFTVKPSTARTNKTQCISRALGGGRFPGPLLTFHLHVLRLAQLLLASFLLLLLLRVVMVVVHAGSCCCCGSDAGLPAISVTLDLVQGRFD